MSRLISMIFVAGAAGTSVNAAAPMPPWPCHFAASKVVICGSPYHGADDAAEAFSELGLNVDLIGNEATRQVLAQSDCRVVNTSPGAIWHIYARPRTRIATIGRYATILEIQLDGTGSSWMIDSAYIAGTCPAWDWTGTDGKWIGLNPPAQQ